MKKSVKIITAIMSVLTMMSLLVFPSFAEEAHGQKELIIKASIADVEYGEDPIIEISIEKNSGFIALMLGIVLPEDMTIKSVENHVTEFTCSYGKSIVLDAENEYSGTGPLLSIACEIPLEKRGKTADVLVVITDAIDSSYYSVVNRGSIIDISGNYLPKKDPVVPGDVNGNGTLDILDLVRLKKYMSGEVTEINTANADVNENGEVDILDLVRLKKMLAGNA